MVAAGREWNIRIGSYRRKMTVVAMSAGPAMAGGTWWPAGPERKQMVTAEGLIRYTRRQSRRPVTIGPC
jgi:hypothetical protein